jgi:hypothetical protein
MKTIFLAAFSLLFAGTSLFAQNVPQANPPFNAEPLSVSGKATIADNGWVTLAADGKTYTLLYPRYSAVAISIKNGDTISVTGYVVPGPPWADQKAVFLRVTQADINGKTYVFVGPGPGPRGEYGRGHGYGPMMGPGYGNGPMTGRGWR